MVKLVIMGLIMIHVAFDMSTHFDLKERIKINQESISRLTELVGAQAKNISGIIENINTMTDTDNHLISITRRIQGLPEEQWQKDLRKGRINK